MSEEILMIAHREDWDDHSGLQLRHNAFQCNALHRGLIGILKEVHGYSALKLIPVIKTEQR